MAAKDIQAHKFKKGQTGNPNGRPKKLPQIDTLIADILGEEKDGTTAAEAILKKLRQMAASGNLKAAEMLLDRAYGKAKQAIEHTGKDGAEIQIRNIIIEIPDDGGDK